MAEMSLSLHLRMRDTTATGARARHGMAVVSVFGGQSMQNELR
jgi:hypothetical protein